MVNVWQLLNTTNSQFSNPCTMYDYCCFCCHDNLAESQTHLNFNVLTVYHKNEFGDTHFNGLYDLFAQQEVHLRKILKFLLSRFDSTLERFDTLSVALLKSIFVPDSKCSNFLKLNTIKVSVTKLNFMNFMLKLLI